MERKLHRIANHPLLMLLAGVDAALAICDRIFGWTHDMGYSDIFQAITMLILLGVVYVLQWNSRYLTRLWNARRAVDAAIHQYRAEVLYKGRWNFPTEAGLQEHLNTLLTEEFHAVKKHVLYQHPDLPRKDLDEALKEHYGIA